MTTIIVSVTDQHEALKFDNVEHYYETRKGLEIIQEDMYQTMITVIMKENILRYTISEHR